MNKDKISTLLWVMYREFDDLFDYANFFATLRKIETHQTSTNRVQIDLILEITQIQPREELIKAIQEFLPKARKKYIKDWEGTGFSEEIMKHYEDGAMRDWVDFKELNWH